MTFSLEDTRGELRARCSDSLRERVEAFADEHGETNSDVIRDAVREYLPDDGDMSGPKDPDLRETWRWLRDRADERNRISGKAALSELSQRLSMKEEFVKRSRFDPLRRDGWIEARGGVITVVEQ